MLNVKEEKPLKRCCLRDLEFAAAGGKIGTRVNHRNVPRIISEFRGIFSLLPSPEFLSLLRLNGFFITRHGARRVSSHESRSVQKSNRKVRYRRSA